MAPIKQSGTHTVHSLLSRDVFVKALNAHILPSGIEENEAFCFTSVTCDSRTVNKKSLFIPLIGTVQNGHIYIPQALEKGASVILIASSEYQEKSSHYDSLARSHTDVFFAVVVHTLTALQAAAAAYLERFPNLIRIGITGSNGKTTTKEIAYSILSTEYRTIANEGNYNSETGLPLSIFCIREEHQVGIFEMGMNRRGEIAELAAVLRPCFALITNIGTAHIGILGTQDAIAEEKKEIFSCFSSENTGFIPENTNFADFLAKDVPGTIIRYSLKNAGGSVIRNIISKGIHGYDFTYEDRTIHFPLCGEHNIQNASGVIALARTMGIRTENIQKGLEGVKPILGRSYIIEGDITLINDCYNANVESMHCAFDLCDSITWNGRKIYVIGDMKELGSESKKAHEDIARHLASSKADAVFLYGNDIQYALAICSNVKKTFYTTDMNELKHLVDQYVHSGDMVLLKASHSMELERLTEIIEAKNKGASV